MKAKGNYIALLDPSLQNNEGLPSFNLGDLIINESVMEVLSSLFPSKEIVRISSHVALDERHRVLVNDAYLVFVGGTNLLTSDMRGFRLLYIREGKLVWLFPGVKNLILFGVGWGNDYLKKISLKTNFFYQRILNPDFTHSIRDEYSAHKLKHEANIKALNTSCPTMWNLSSIDMNRKQNLTTTVFTLTDYDTNTVADQKLLTILFDHFNDVIFFPQGAGDIQYLNSLPGYQKNRSKVKVLHHSYSFFKEYISKNNLTYIGTRLHAGIKCMQYGHEAFIIAIDNRATQIAKDTHIAICQREDYSPLLRWLDGKKIFSECLNIHSKEIKLWKNQFC